MIDTPIRNSTCEFCGEFGGDSANRFHSLYGCDSSRTVARYRGFVAQPTLGQLFTGSMLILPEDHVERMVDLSHARRHDALRLVNRVELMIHQFGPTIVWEHGARPLTNGGCGIYHAHFHVVPVPAMNVPEFCDFTPEGGKWIPTDSLDSALSVAKTMDEYLVFRDTKRRAAILPIYPAMRAAVPSQFVRRALVERYGLESQWDWRTYGKEQKLLTTLQHFECAA